ncbi:uncharacterized protein LOC127858416 [Dreissena polymorpha]|nr:uncharacterized protein LOC127858416 [Dreissena polymorpha]XP_052251516.1 uncharacterized protein LOC127858416 [Dreissena polymorpha]
MTIRSSSSFESWKVYPRVHYFRKRFLDLYPRFKRVIGSLRFNINFDLMWRIDNAFNWFQNDLEIVFVGNAVLPKENAFVDINPEPKASHSASGSHEGVGNIDLTQEKAFVHISAEQQTSHHTTGSRVFLCYVQQTNEQFIQTLDNVLDYLCANISAREPLFWIVDLANSPTPQEQAFINNYISTKAEMMSRVLFGSGQLEVATTISDYIEENLADIFGLISECLLSVGMTSTFRKRGGIVIDNSNYKGRFNTDMRAYMREYDSEHDLDKTQLSRMFKCNFLIDYFVRKYSIPAGTVNLILEENDYEKRFTNRIASAMQTEIKNMGWDLNKHKKNYTLGWILNAISDVIKLLEEACEQTRETLSVMKKMLFEVNNYLHQSPFGNYTNLKDKSPVVSQTLRKKLLGIPGVYCIGTVFGEFTIYLKPECGEEVMVDYEDGRKVQPHYNVHAMDVDSLEIDFKNCRKDIRKLMKDNSFHYPYTIEVVRIKLTAQFEVEDGKTISSPWPDQTPSEYRRGTLGGIARDDDGNLFGLTCAHVVSSPHPGHAVFINEGQEIHHFATSSPLMTVAFGENPTFTLVDVAAVKVEQDMYDYCNIYMKDEEGVHKPWALYESRQDAVADERVVYKYGATTGFTRGLVASADLELPVPDLPGAIQPPDSHLILIDCLPDIPEHKRPFSGRGDSGAIVCFEMPMDNFSVINTVTRSTVFALSMIHAGEMTVDGDTSSKSVSFMLATGFRLLMAQSNVQLKCPIPQ